VNQSEVSDFLARVDATVKPKANQEYEKIRFAKKQVESSEVVEPWDLPYYTNVIRNSEMQNVSPKGTHFAIANCVEGLSLLTSSLFGISLKQVSMEATESWAPGVSKLVLMSSDSDNLGTIYLDLHPREDKYLHAAHFTIQCGTPTQLPIVALVCNFSSENISHSDLEVLFHEFGHATHSLLSRTTYQHLSGTRGAIDYVEIPSHLFENFAWDHSFLKRFAVDLSTGDVISEETLSSLKRGKHLFSGIDNQMQVLYSQFDQQLFGGADVNVDSSEIFARLHASKGVPYAPDTHWFAR
jgi:intermediate peptidase